MLQHEYQLAKVGFDMAENEPSNVPYILYLEALFTAQPYMPEVSEMVDKKKSISDTAESQLHNMTEKARFADTSQLKAAAGKSGFENSEESCSLWYGYLGPVTPRDRDYRWILENDLTTPVASCVKKSRILKSLRNFVQRSHESPRMSC